MTTEKDSDNTSAAPLCGRPSWDRNDPRQQEVTRITQSLVLDIMGVVSLGKDGIYRSLTADRKVIDAQPMTNEQIKLFLGRFPDDYRSEMNLEDANGTATPKEKWFMPDKGILPRPMSQEAYEKAKNMSEEEKERLRKLMRDNPKLVDSDGFLGPQSISET